MGLRPTLPGFDTYGLSNALWSKIPYEYIFAGDRNYGWGFLDDFTNFHGSTLEGQYLILATQGDIEQVNCTGNTATTAIGQVVLPIVGDTGNDETVLQWGRGLCAPFKFANSNLYFEARLAVSLTTAAKWSWAIGLGEVGMGATDCLFVDTTGALADKNFCGYVHLQAESTALDAAFKADGETYQNGATKTKLDTIKTVTAATFFKVGFMYENAPTRRLRYFIDGAEVASATLSASELAADTFPDDVFMAPIFGFKDLSGSSAAVNGYLDWWACAQLAY